MDDPAVVRRHRVVTTVRRLGRRGSDDHLSDYDRHRLLNRRLEFTARVLPWAFLIAAIALSTIVVLLPADTGMFRWVWPSVVAVSSIAFSLYWLGRSTR